MREATRRALAALTISAAALVAAALVASALVASAPSATAKPLPLEAAGQVAAVEWTRFAIGQGFELARVEQAVWDLQQQVGAFVADVIAQEEAWTAQQAEIARENAAAAAAVRVPQSSSAEQTVPAPQTGGGGSSSGGHSDAWWAGVATCESGMRNLSPYGYFSIMSGEANGLSYGEQLAIARRIDASAGDGAWAQACQNAGWAASPGG